MTKQKESVLTPGKLLDEKGNLREAGYSTELVKEYDRKDIKAGKSRIKEWDYYYFGDEQYGIALTLDDNGYRGLVSFSVLDFTEKKYHNHSSIFFFPFGKTGLPCTSKDGSVTKKGKNYSFSFVNQSGRRQLIVSFKTKEGSFSCERNLCPTRDHSLVVATPFKKDRHFYYNQKINLLKGDGFFSYKGRRHDFKNCYGVLDWGRGVWTYKNTWYWSSLSGEQDGVRIGFNLGYGFGDTSKASENILFVNNRYYKFTDVTFSIPKDRKGKEDYLKTWEILSSNKDIELKFVPILDRHDKASALFISQDAHQVFGRFYGVFRTPEGNVTLNGRLGFAEKVKNRW